MFSLLYGDTCNTPVCMTCRFELKALLFFHYTSYINMPLWLELQRCRYNTVAKALKFRF